MPQGVTWGNLVAQFVSDYQVKNLLEEFVKSFSAGKTRTKGFQQQGLFLNLH